LLHDGDYAASKMQRKAINQAAGFPPPDCGLF